MAAATAARLARFSAGLLCSEGHSLLSRLGQPGRHRCEVRCRCTMAVVEMDVVVDGRLSRLSRLVRGLMLGRLESLA